LYGFLPVVIEIKENLKSENQKSFYHRGHGENTGGNLKTFGSHKILKLSDFLRVLRGKSALESVKR
jgi:hypothetical protein